MVATVSSLIWLPNASECIESRLKCHTSFFKIPNPSISSLIRATDKFLEFASITNLVLTPELFTKAYFKTL